MSLYNKSGGKIPEITVEERLKVLLTNAIGIYAEVHSDRYNSNGEFLEFLYGDLGTDGEFFKVGEGRAALAEDKISDDTAVLRTMAAVAMELRNAEFIKRGSCLR